MNDMFGPGKIDSAWFGLAGVLLGSVLAFCKDMILERFRFKREGGYFGLVVIQKLDAFVDECLEAAHDNGRDEFGAPSDRNSGNCEPIVGTPKLEFEIKDINWKAIPHDLTYDIINLNIDADRVENEVCRFSENDPSHDYSDTMTMRQRGYADLGLRAYRIANRLRKEIKLSSRTSRFGQEDVDKQLIDIKVKLDMKTAGQR